MGSVHAMKKSGGKRKREIIDLNKMIIALHCLNNPLIAKEFGLPAEKADAVLNKKVNRLHLMLKNNIRMHTIFAQLKELSELDGLDNLELLMTYLRTKLDCEMSKAMTKRIGTFFKSDSQTAELLVQKLAC